MVQTAFIVVAEDVKDIDAENAVGRCDRAAKCTGPDDQRSAGDYTADRRPAHVRPVHDFRPKGIDPTNFYNQCVPTFSHPAVRSTRPAPKEQVARVCRDINWIIPRT
jgi:hypothetical protein